MAEPKSRISKVLREALRLMVEDGLTRAKAAEMAGMTDHGLYSALRKPHVRALRREMVGSLRESAASRTIARAEKLADEAESEHVRNDANKWLASLDEATAPRSAKTDLPGDRFPGSYAPGLVIIMAPPAPPHLIPSQNGQPIIEAGRRLLPAPVPHPAMVKRENSDVG